MYAIVINAGPMSSDDNEVYFCKEEPTFAAVSVLVKREDDKPSVADIHKFVEFTPKNGRRKHEKHSVPLERLVYITESVNG